MCLPQQTKILIVEFLVMTPPSQFLNNFPIFHEGGGLKRKTFRVNPENEELWFGSCTSRGNRQRSGIRQYIKDKPTKWGIKLWVLADSSNAYVQDFNIYIGKQAGREVRKHGLAYDVVMTLMQNYLDQGYHLFIDNFY